MRRTRTKVAVRNTVISAGGRRIPLVSGEFHYWRTMRENWGPILESIRGLGLELVASYVPWNYHETAPGVHDFTGKTGPQRDLAGFVELVAKAGLSLIIRPGPYIYSEWPFGGVPERAAKHDRLSPEFLSMASRYIADVCDVLVPFQATRGGPIVMMQADNEPYPPVESFGNEIGCFGRPGLFKEWLRDKYAGDLDLLNRRWHASFSSFDEPCFHFHEPYVNVALPMAQRLLPHPEYYIRYADSMEFVGWYGTRIVETVAGWMRDRGVDVPIFANGWSPLYQDFTGLCRAVDTAGTDIYPLPFMESGAQTEDEYLYVMDILKLSQADVSDGNVWSAEFQSGLYPLRLVGYLPPAHFRFVPLSLMARGLRGWNWYMLVNRDNWYNCPINEWGRPNEYYDVHRDVVAAARAVRPWETDELLDASLLVCKPHRVISPGNFRETFAALEEADLSYDYFDPAARERPRCDVLVYSGDDWMERERAGALAAFVRAGGTLLAFNRFPQRDEFGEPLEGLPFVPPDGARPVNLPVTVAFPGADTVVRNAGHMGCKVNFFYYRAVPGDPVELALSTRARELLVDIGARESARFAIGYSRRVGRGRILHIGSNPSGALLAAALRSLGREPWVSSDSPDLSVRLHRREDGVHILFAVNRSPRPAAAAVRLNAGRLGFASAVIEPLSPAGAPPPGGTFPLPSVRVGARDVAVFAVRPRGAGRGRARPRAS